MYNFKDIEKKWQKYWDENGCFKAQDDFAPSQTIPPAEFRVLIIVLAICSFVPSFI